MPTPITLTIRPNAQGFYNTVDYAAFGAASKPLAVSDGLNTSGFQIPPASAGAFESYQCSDIASPGGSLVSKVEWFITFELVSDGNPDAFVTAVPLLRLNGIDLTAAAKSIIGGQPSIQTQSEIFLTKPGGGAFTIFDANALEIGTGGANYGGTGFANARVLDLWANVTFTPIPLKLENVRKVITLRTLLRRTARALPTIEGPLALANAQPGDLVLWSHPDAPEASGEGWGERPWERHPSWLLRTVIDPNTMRVTMQAEDARRYLFLLYDEGRSLINASSFANGVGRYYVGTRTYVRASKAWVVDPSDETVREVSYDIEKLSGGEFPGQLLEGESTNSLKRSSMVSGTTGISLTGTGTNGSAIALDALDLLFSSTITPNSLKFTAGAPHTADLFAAWPVTASFAANTLCSFSAWHKDDGGAVLYWRAQRGADSKYWHHGLQTWTVSVANNAFPESGVGLRAPYAAEAINVGAAATTITISVGQLAGGTAGRVNRVYHVQWELMPWASSPIVTDAAEVTRSADALTYQNDAATGRNWLAARGTLAFEFIPQWTAANAAGRTFVLYSLRYDAGNWFRVLYDGTSGQLRFEVRAANATVTATKAWTPARAEVYQIVARWTGTAGELGLAPHTASIFIDGARGTDATGSAAPTEAAVSELCFGHDAGGDIANGVLRRTWVTQDVYTDAEIVRGVPLR